MFKNRTQQNLNPSLERKLASYTLAGAAALSALAVSPVEAAIVYTSAKDIGEGQDGKEAVAPIDLNHDGKIDFNLVGYFFSVEATSVIFRSAFLKVAAQPGNQVGVVSTFAGIGVAQALNFGQEVGPSLRFSSAIRHTFELAEFVSIGFGPQSHIGEFYDQKNKFVALKLALNGNTYYGWARVSTKEVGNKLAFELVDYAYQSTPNLPILAGQGIPKPEADLLAETGNSLDAALAAQATKTPLPAALGLLAYGAKALPLWRRPLNSGAAAVR